MFTLCVCGFPDTDEVKTKLPVGLNVCARLYAGLQPPDPPWDKWIVPPILNRSEKT